jgi:hypothetical protein
VLNDYTLGSDLDRQFGDLPVGLRKILLSMIHGFARAPLAVSFTLDYVEARPAARGFPLSCIRLRISAFLHSF